MAQAIVYLRGSGEALWSLLTGMTSRGYRVESLRDFDEMLRLVRVDPPALVIVDASSGENEAAGRVVELSSATELRSVPIIFLGSQAEKRTTLLRKQYARFVAVEVPFRLNDVLDGVATIFPPPGPGKSSGGFRATSFEVADAAVEKNIEKDPSGVQEGYGGKALFFGNSLADFPLEELIPEHPKKIVIDQTLQRITQGDPQLGLHLRRVGYLSSILGRKTGFPSAQESQLRIAGLLSGISLGEGGEASRVDPLSDPTKKGFEILAESFRQSAVLVREQIDDELISRTLESASLLLLGKDAPEHERVVQSAQILVLTDMVNRACWSTGYWSQSGAHRAFRGLKEGLPFVAKTEVRDAILRLVAEASGESPFVVAENLPPISPEELAIFDQETRNSEQKYQKGTFRFVPLFDLMPGMALARPIFSWDGRLISPSSVELDQDLIERLWRLSVIRPLKQPIAIVGRPERS